MRAAAPDLQPNASPFAVDGLVACVTGASSGLGRAMASMLAEAGARVVGIARRSDALEAWRAETNGETAALAHDLGNRARLDEAAERASEPFGTPDILVNAAGVNTREAADDVTAEGWDRTIHLNLTVPFMLAQALVPDMREKGWGRIINIASLQSRRAFPGGIAYGASKGGVEQMTRAMAEAWSPYGIGANALAPGFFPTELTAPVFGDESTTARLAAQTAIGRNGRMEDMRGPLLFLASRAADYVTGQVLFVDGGFTAK